jgi:hypothetical protein
MSILSDAKYSLAIDVAKTSRNQLYGLHYTINWDALHTRLMAVKALEFDDLQNYYSQAERDIIESYLSSGKASCSCCGF